MYRSFGDAARYDVDGDGKVAFVFHRFGEDMAHAAGYFWSGDLFSKEELEQEGSEYADFTNEMDMLHLSTTNKSSGALDKDRIMGTLVHELQHLVNYAQTDGNGESWLNEVFSQAAMAITGYGETGASLMQGLWFSVYNGVGVPFVFEGWYAPGPEWGDVLDITYEHWFLFSRYLANQTRGLASEDGTLRGGDELYKSVLACERDVEGSGSCTRETLAKTLEAIGYLGEGRAAEDFDELVLNYSTALLVRDRTGPYSLTNDPDADPSAVDGARIDLLTVADRFVPGAVYGGGATVYVPLDRAQRTAGAGDVVQERVVDSPLPLDFVGVVPSLASGSALCDGDPMVFSSPQLDTVEGGRLEYCTMSLQEYDETSQSEWTFQVYEGPVAFDADAPVVVVRPACDRGAFYPGVFFYEVDASDPGPVEPEEPAPGPVPDEEGGGDEPADKDEPAGADAGGRAPSALAPTGDAAAGAAPPLAFAACLALAALAAAR